MKITGKFLLRCMRHTFIWALDTFIMCADYHLRRIYPTMNAIVLIMV